VESSSAPYAAKLTYCAEKDSVLSWVVRHVEHRELGTTEKESWRKEKVRVDQDCFYQTHLL